MTVQDFVEYLLTLDQSLVVAYQRFSEQCELELEEMEVVDLCYPRNDGWIQDARPDMPTRKYLLLPGN